MSDHSPEPWKAVGNAIDNEAHRIASTLGGTGSGRHVSDARRIVACVNACAGISNEILEQAARVEAIEKALPTFAEAAGGTDGGDAGWLPRYKGRPRLGMVPKK